ncbi:MAG TPA: Gfo/Idh/MocA family oxidoreductase [Bryobacteraceae bacterium]|jgi:predicted dehydrogenase|nr:Gfo/Idh/MocA family oxidoreductase [Bryobacteraceae bacterium]
MEKNDRRDFLKYAASGAFTTAVFTGRVRGANDRISLGFIGMGKMGRANLRYALGQENVNVVSVCDVYDRNLNWAVELTKGQAKGLRDFREVLADKSIDAVCISTPDHWHAYMTVEACKAGKDVYVEKPICVVVDEGVKMVQAARKYGRVVQAGTMQRSAEHFQKAADIVRSGQLGKVAFVRTWNYGNMPQEGIGNPPDSDPPAGLDWDMWLGPAPKRPFNENRWGIDPNDKWFSHFRWFWDYAGGMMTDWGVHWLDIVQLAFNEEMPSTITALGGKFWLKDNRETPDTLEVVYEYPSGMIATYENRNSNAQSMFQKGGGILFHGTKGTLFVDRSEYRIVPERGSDLEPATVKASSSGNKEHWANFLHCIRTREKPTSDIEKCQRSTTTCLLGNVALRSRLRLDFDPDKWTVAQAEARKYLTREYRKPWKLTV